MTPRSIRSIRSSVVSPLLVGLLVVLGGLQLGCGGSDSSSTGPEDAPDATDATDAAEIGTSDAPDAIDVADVVDAVDATDAADAPDGGDSGGLVCGSSTCKATEWCVIPCCGGADTGTPCTPPPPYCTPGGCSGSGCDSLCFGRTATADPAKRTVQCMCA